jgi:hypothetical protein
LRRNIMMRMSRWSGREHGSIATLVVMILFMNILVLVAARLMMTALTGAFQDQHRTAVIHAAEGGLQHMLFVGARNLDYQTGERLPADTNGDGRPDFSAGGEAAWVLAQAQSSANLLSLTTGESVYMKPTRDDGSRADRLYAVGYVPNRAEARAVRALKVLYTAGFTSRMAVITNGDLVIGGSPTIHGAAGSVHSNGSLSISGNPTIAGNATASGRYTQSGTPNIGGESGGQYATLALPVIDPFLFRRYADYELRADGKVYAGQSGKAGSPGTLLADAAGVAYRGWKQASAYPSQWTYSGNTAYDGSYYVEGDGIVSGNPGEAGQLWKTTIIATGSIEVSGNPKMEGNTLDVGLVAGGDLKINGTPQQYFDGALLAREQLLVSGNPNIVGYLIAASTVDVSTMVQGPSIIPGNPRITFGGGSEPIPGGMTVNRWQELTNFP